MPFSIHRIEPAAKKLIESWKRFDDAEYRLHALFSLLENLPAFITTDLLPHRDQNRIFHYLRILLRRPIPAAAGMNRRCPPTPGSPITVPLERLEEIRTRQRLLAPFVDTGKRPNLYTIFEDQVLGAREEDLPGGLLERTESSSLVVLVRRIVGVDRAAVNTLFSEFISDKGFSLRQMRFVEMIVDHLGDGVETL